MRVLVTVLLILFYCISNGQLISISSDNNKALYAGVENPLTITVDNVSSKKIIAKTDIGKLTGESGHYTFYTDTGSFANITLYKKGTNEKIGTVNFYIRQIPDPRPRIGTYTGGEIPLAYIKSQPGIRTDILTFYYKIGIPITSFTVSIIRNNDYVFKEIRNEGELFNKEVNTAFQQLKPGDSVVINNIFAKRHDGTLTILSPLAFTIKN